MSAMADSLSVDVERDSRTSAGLVVGIDASNIRAGGGVTHLVELLRAASPSAQGFAKVVVWASQATLARIEERPWLVKRSNPVMEGHYLRRALWQRNRLGELARAEGCNLLFIPGGSFATDFRPVVTMSRNLLPFEWRELWRYGISLTSLRLMLLRWSQSHSFRKADGVIFLTHYAENAVLKVTGTIHGERVIIPHGINERFFRQPRIQRQLEECDEQRPIRLMYVSIIANYKHQTQVVEAVTKLRIEGIPIILDLIGPAYPPALRRLRRTLQRVDPAGRFVRYVGPVPYNELHAWYEAADLCVFASSCENMPNILLEGMAFGLPIACSNRGPMPEVLGDAGTYFNPEDPIDIAKAIQQWLGSPDLRRQKALAAHNLARRYSWTRCATETFSFLARVVTTTMRSDGQTI